MPENAQYVPVPALLNARWEFEARAFYTFEALGAVEEVHAEYFNAIHRDRLNIDTVEKLAEWGDENGISGAGYSEYFSIIRH